MTLLSALAVICEAALFRIDVFTSMSFSPFQLFYSTNMLLLSFVSFSFTLYGTCERFPPFFCCVRERFSVLHSLGLEERLRAMQSRRKHYFLFVYERLSCAFFFCFHLLCLAPVTAAFGITCSNSSLTKCLSLVLLRLSFLISCCRCLRS